jgi:hypothetical protein
MKHLHFSSVSLALLVATAPLSRAAEVPGFVDFGKLAPGDSGAEFVEVNVNSNLISMVARLAHKSEPDVASIIQGLKSIRVNVVGLTDENRSDVVNRVKAIRADLDTQGWDKVVNVQQKKEDVGVYVKTSGADAIQGVVVTVLDGKKQAVLINVVGNINPDKLGMLGERFNIDPLKKMAPRKHKEAAEEEPAEKESSK